MQLLQSYAFCLSWSQAFPNWGKGVIQEGRIGSRRLRHHQIALKVRIKLAVAGWVLYTVRKGVQFLAYGAKCWSYERGPQASEVDPSASFGQRFSAVETPPQGPARTA